MYNPDNQYRCTIIRGKAQREIDNFLPIYALVLDTICPCLKDEFSQKFKEEFIKFLPEKNESDKTIHNHRTEICGKLFGMYSPTEDGLYIQLSPRTEKYLKDEDQPAFFKDVCYKMQFPSGTQKIDTINSRMNDKINIRQNSFLLKLLLLAKEKSLILTKREIGFYVLNSLDVLQGIATPKEVLDSIIKDRASETFRTIKTNKNESYSWQHITEQLNLLELANLIRVSKKGRSFDKNVFLNLAEKPTIDLFAKEWNTKPAFDVYKYSFDTKEEKDKFQIDWDVWMGELSPHSDKFKTSLKALAGKIEEDTESTIIQSTSPKVLTTYANTTELGNAGEQFVYKYEKDRVRKYNKRLVNKVLLVSGTKGIGYDIQSIVAEPGDKDEWAKYIEVKTSSRVTAPRLDDLDAFENITLTRNEWVAAQQHKERYSIYKVYFTSEGTYLYILDNPYGKNNDGTIRVRPTGYRAEFSNDSADKIVAFDNEVMA